MLDFFSPRVSGIVLISFIMLNSSPVFAQFDHKYEIWSTVLEKYTDKGWVNYERLLESKEDLEQAIEQISSVDLSEYSDWNPGQQIAFWLNAYNMATIHLVLEFYPLGRGKSLKGLAYPANSIQQIPQVWDRDSIHIFGKPVSLNHIEHEILRKEFNEPRIHFALVCASMSCPALREEPFMAYKLDEQLDNQTFQFLLDKSKNRYDSDVDTLYLSRIFKWFDEDFEQGGGVIALFKQHLYGDEYKGIHDNTTIKWLDYDWSLNEK